MTSPKAVILLSGGLDSATTLAIARHAGFIPHAMSFRYGQRHAVELDAARRLAAAFQVAHHLIVDIDPRIVAGSALTSDIDVPRDRYPDDMSRSIPATYVPARNTIFLAHAIAWAEILHSQDIFIGVNALDYSGYPDCRPEYIDAFQRMANLATRAAVQGQQLVIHAPLIHWTKAEIIRRGTALGVDYALTSSCYDPDEEGAACGECDACRLRRKGFAEAGQTDPIRYRNAE